VVVEHDLEAELRSEAYPQVIVGAVEKEDVVADFRSNADGPGKGLKTAARINRKARRTVGQAHAAGETGGCTIIGDGEVVEADLARNKEAERPRPRLKFRTKETMQGAEVRIHGLG